MVNLKKMEGNRKLVYFIIITVILIFWIIFYIFGEKLIQDMYNRNTINMFKIPTPLSKLNDASYFLSLSRHFLIFISFMAIIYITMSILYDKILKLLKIVFMVDSNRELVIKLFNLFILAGCSVTCFYSLLFQGFEGSWYIIEDLMNFKGSSPFQQRILFLLLAKFIHSVFPFLTYIQSYCISQLVPIVLGFYFMKKWVNIFTPTAYSFIAQLILLVMVIPTIYYYTFYDFGIIMFFTLSLYLLFKRKYVTYYLIFAIGILNHEIILFMVFLFVSVNYKDNLFSKDIIYPVFIQVSIYVMVRILQYYALPADAFIATGRIWVNMHYIFNKPLSLLNPLLNIGIWYSLAIIGHHYAPKKLQRCIILIPLLLVMTLFVGQLLELRQFNAFIPIAIAYIMCFIFSTSKDDSESTIRVRCREG